MDKPAEIKKLLQQVVGANPNYPIRGTVTAIDGQTCTVKLVTGLEVSGVRLKATVGDDEDYVLITPKVGTDVLMLADNGTLDGLTVIKADVAEKFEIKQGGLVFLIDGSDGKVQIKNANASLIDIFTDLAELLKVLKVFTPMGPSGTPLPASIQAIEAFKTKFNQLLK